ncbi:MAG: hypothetical protein MUF24_14810 [Chitinophagaceae bacterium]|nr:hypothetical protein [Chitinophagaceae bacterium]
MALNIKSTRGKLVLLALFGIFFGGMAVLILYGSWESKRFFERAKTCEASILGKEERKSGGKKNKRTTYILSVAMFINGDSAKPAAKPAEPQTEKEQLFATLNAISQSLTVPLGSYVSATVAVPGQVYAHSKIGDVVLVAYDPEDSTDIRFKSMKTTD